MKKMWSAATLCVVIAAAGCGQAEFKEFTPAGEGFKVMMPGTPKNETQNAGNITFKNYTAAARNGAYLVSVANMPINKNESDAQIQQRLDGAVQGMVGNVKAQLIEAKPIKLQDKYPGREVTATLPDKKASIHAKIYLVGTKLYQTMAIGTKDWVAGPDTAKFLNSFVLTP